MESINNSFQTFFSLFGEISLIYIIILIFIVLTFFSYITYYLVILISKKIINQKEAVKLSAFISYIKVFLIPLITLIYIQVLSSLKLEIFSNTLILKLLIRLIILWLVYRIIRFYPKKNPLFIVTLINLIFLIILDIFKINGKVFVFEINNFNLSLSKLVEILFLLCLIFWVSTFISSFLKKILDNNTSIEQNTKSLLQKIINTIIYSVFIFLAIDILGVDLSSFAFIGGALGVGIGFGLQKITSNFISGIILLLDKTIKEGNLIEIDGGPFGFIKSIGARSTLIEGFEGKEVLVPNENLITEKVTNWTYSNKKGRIDINVGVSYSSDIKLVKTLLQKIIEEHPLVSKSKKGQVFLSEFGDSSINFFIVFWVDRVDQGRLLPKSEVLLSIWQTFKDNNIEIPFPQIDLHVKSKGKFKEKKNERFNPISDV